MKSHPPPSKPPHHEMAQGPARLRLLVAVGILVGVLANGYGSATAEAASPCSPRAFEGLNYIICTFDLRAYALRLFWKDEGGQPYGGFDHLPRKVNGPWWLGEIVGAVHHVGTKALGEFIDCPLQLALPNTGAEQIELNQIVDAD